MENKQFNREKMQWLNAISLECEVKSTAFRIAYLIADHQNRTTGFAWPSLARLAEKICMTKKSVHRAVDQLEEAGWLDVKRKANCSNRYRMRWPPGRTPLPAPKERKEDTNVPLDRQRYPSGRDANVSRTYLINQPKTFSSGLGGGKHGGRFNDRGMYEAEIIRRFGPDIIELFQRLEEIKPTAVEDLCRKEKSGTLTHIDIAAARLAVRQHQAVQQ